MITGGPFLKPDSVIVHGAKRDIDKLSEIPTAKLDYGKLSSNVNRYIPLDIPDKVKVEPDRIKLSIFVEKYTEVEITVPVVITNLPDSLDIELIPSEVMLSFQVPVSEYKNTSASDFHVHADFQQKKGNNLFPEIAFQPDYIQHARLHTEKIKFILSKHKQE
jgi:YbbR domain-containing protein